MNKRKLTRESLTELAMRMPVLSENVQKSFIGGGNGTAEDPYTWEEYYNMTGSMWTGGYVGNSYTYIYSQSEYEALSESGLWSGGIVGGMGTVLPEVVCLGGGREVSSTELRKMTVDDGSELVLGIITGIINDGTGPLSVLLTAIDTLREQAIDRILDYMEKNNLETVYERETQIDGYDYIGYHVVRVFNYYDPKTGEFLGTITW